MSPAMSIPATPNVLAGTRSTSQDNLGTSAHTLRTLRAASSFETAPTSPSPYATSTEASPLMWRSNMTAPHSHHRSSQSNDGLAPGLQLSFDATRSRTTTAQSWEEYDEDEVDADLTTPNRRSRTVIEIEHSPESTSAPALPNIRQRHRSEYPLGFWGSCQYQRDSRPLIWAAIKAALIFGLALGGLVALLRASLPPLDPEDAPRVKIPKSFDDLKDLNEVLQIYKVRNHTRVLISFIFVYLFLQTFSLPGSMYLSILSGAMYGLWALPLVCLCISTGASLCYLFSAALGPALLLTSKKWQDRVIQWRDIIKNQGSNLISYLIVLRIAPLPPHSVINVVLPHVGVGLPMFWISTFLGVMGVSFIHVQIGTTLETMTSPADFHLISWTNFFGLAGIVAAVLVPVVLRRLWRTELEDAAQDPSDRIALPDSPESAISSLRPRAALEATTRDKSKDGNNRPVLFDEPDKSHDSSKEESSEDEAEEESDALLPRTRSRPS
ncbi:uncharacterized protein L969DRAFT_93798 [Mixia osmundae IAM 14324]|uniref:VTT domain-containing protein n=1 Tax=Mixia osmundae (strain CBS 9802 / IAM 14324 / JCM 22182 / KY 12970) TaxID=764103 RepID=G7E9L8_MIXOS|nr:uncharacterized protein L969DRAFT_93798 [Mixia osmundae IAM 14324]KEI39967.1 hypothetical protein L969DRAFT_93798 [Mixia osmundae IAM 14324]GAA99337.1 hypothetical protein E5Q_06032 [Mixia osmundae IAM 14324]